MKALCRQTILVLSSLWLGPLLSVALGLPKQSTPEAAPPAIRTLVRRLGSSDASERRAAAEALGKRGSDAAPAIPALVDVLGDDAVDRGA